MVSDDDLTTLRDAKRTFENPGFAIRVASLVGKPFDRALGFLPQGARAAILEGTEAAIRKCLDAALRTLGRDAPAAMPANRLLHKVAVAATGAAGGAFGLAAMLIELPVTTTLMFRSICEIARSEGEDPASPDTQLQCLSVFALGGSSSADDSAESGYFALRAALAEFISQSVAELAGRGAGANSASVVARLIQRIAERFSVQVGQQAGAKSIPVLGAVFGAGINTLFIDHFQNMAQAHFAIRRLERKYGAFEVERSYQAL